MSNNYCLGSVLKPRPRTVRVCICLSSHQIIYFIVNVRIQALLQQGKSIHFFRQKQLPCALLVKSHNLNAGRLVFHHCTNQSCYEGPHYITGAVQELNWCMLCRGTYKEKCCHLVSAETWKPSDGLIWFLTAGGSTFKGGCVDGEGLLKPSTHVSCEVQKSHSWAGMQERKSDAYRELDSLAWVSLFYLLW